MEKIKKLIKRAFFTPDDIEEMSFLEIVLEAIFEGVILGVVINLVKMIILFLGITVLLVILSIFF